MATAQPPILNLVRVDTLATTEALDVEAASTIYTQHDEVELATPAGEPAAIPDGGWIDNDYPHDYINGGRGSTRRRRRHTVSMAIDYLGAEVRAKLERWMHERATVRLCPGYGRYTDLAWRPIEGTGTIADLTGRYTLTTAGNNGSYWWDPWHKVMRGSYTGTNPRRVVWTPHGAGQVCHCWGTNRHIPGTPATADEGFAAKSGWRKGGDDSADITFALVTGGFGHDDAPHSLRVTTNADTSSSRHIIATTLWDSGSGDYGSYAFTGAGYAAVRVWLKGRFPAAATISFGLTGGTAATANLADYDLSEWTPVSLYRYEADWSTAIPFLKIDLPAAAAADRADFQVGPVVVLQSAGYTMPQLPEWSPSGTSVGGSYMSLASYTFPAAGSMLCAFYLPAGVNPATYVAYLMGHTAAARLTVAAGQVLHMFRGASVSVSGAVSLTAGAVHVAAAVWDTGTKSLYFDGELVASAAATEQDVDYSTAATLYIGNNGTDSPSMHPGLLLSARIDRKAYSADEIARMSKTILDPVANAIAVHARGRAYTITRLPSTPRNCIDGTHWIGMLELEEQDYTSTIADVCSEEPY